MYELMLFSDGSVDPSSNIGYGAYLALPRDTVFADMIKQSIKVKRFDNTSSTKLELETLLWALSDIDIQILEHRVIVYTDSQNIIGLDDRRKRFEQNDYFSNTGRRINNYELYKDFYNVTDRINCTFVKLKGHKKLVQKNNIDKLFMLVDRASRNALRNKLI